jgi:hypothetical protein
MATQTKKRERRRQLLRHWANYQQNEVVSMVLNRQGVLPLTALLETPVTPEEWMAPEIQGT